MTVALEGGVIFKAVTSASVAPVTLRTFARRASWKAVNSCRVIWVTLVGESEREMVNELDSIACPCWYWSTSAE